MSGDPVTGPQAWPIDNIGPKRSDGTRMVTLADTLYVYVTDEQLAAAGITPPPDPIDFDALADRLEAHAIGGEQRQKVYEIEGLPYDPALAQRVTDLRLAADALRHVPAPPTKLDALHALGFNDHELRSIESGLWNLVDISNAFVSAVREARND